MAHAFEIVAGHLALDFANTLDNRYRRERLVDLLPTYERFLLFAVQSAIITPSQARRLLSQTSPRDQRRALGRVLELREALYFLFQSIATGKPPRRSHLRTFNRFLSDARVPAAIVWRKQRFAQRLPDLARTSDAPLWPIIQGAAELLTSPHRHQVRECAQKTCRWLFLDRSRNHSRRWCDMKVCGNRLKAQRFHARLRGES